MAYDFNLDDIFQMAVRIEENGAEFYRKAAQTRTDAGERVFLENLARMEDQHKHQFLNLYAQLPDHVKAPTAFDPEEENSVYLMAMADAHDGEGNPDAAEALTGKETLRDIVATAMELEKKSILFYVGLQKLVPMKYGGDQIQTIIKEEQHHVVQLQAVLARS